MQRPVGSEGASAAAQRAGGTESEEGLAESRAQLLLAFLRGEGDAEMPGRSLKAVLGWSLAELEAPGDHFHWMFPTDARCPIYLDAPILTARALASARADPGFLLGVRRSFEKLLEFLGLKLVSSGACAGARLTVRKATGSNGFQARRSICWEVTSSEGNQSWDHISRCLASLRLLALHSELAAFSERLERLWVRGRLPLEALKAAQTWQSVSGLLELALPPHGSLTGFRRVLSRSGLSCSGPSVSDRVRVQWKQGIGREFQPPAATEVVAIQAAIQALLKEGVLRNGMSLTRIECGCVEGLQYSAGGGDEDLHMTLGICFTAFQGIPAITGDFQRKAYTQVVEVRLRKSDAWISLLHDAHNEAATCQDYVVSQVSVRRDPGQDLFVKPTWNWDTNYNMGGFIAVHVA